MDQGAISRCNHAHPVLQDLLCLWRNTRVFCVCVTHRQADCWPETFQWPLHFPDLQPGLFRQSCKYRTKTNAINTKAFSQMISWSMRTTVLGTTASLRFSHFSFVAQKCHRIKIPEGKSRLVEELKILENYSVIHWFVQYKLKECLGDWPSLWIWLIVLEKNNKFW